MIKSLFDTVKIKIIFYELLINFAKELMIFKITKPLNPSSVRLLTIVRLLGHI
jgi:hypothetical protein